MRQTVQIGGNASGEATLGSDRQRATQVNQAGDSAPVDRTEAVLSKMEGFVRGSDFVWAWMSTYGVIFLDIQGELDGALAGVCYAELNEREPQPNDHNSNELRH